ncbi:Polysaccharide deacetylase [Entamoeba marina]
MQRMIDEGHEIGNHTMYDEPSFKNTPSEFNTKAQQTHEILLEYMNHQQHRWFRPGSAIPRTFMKEFIKNNNYTLALGSRHPFDAQITNTSINYMNLKSNITPGDIFILHDRKYNIELFEKFLEYLTKKGYQVNSLGEMARLTNSFQILE